MADLPTWSPFDASRPPELPEHGERPGRLVVVLTTETARANGWAHGATVDMVGRWTAGGRRVVVADVGLESPSLHTVFDAPNAEGVVDVVEYGSSVRRVARASSDSAFFYITAGSPCADAARVLESDRWRRLCSGFLDAGVTLVAFAHDGGAGLDHVLDLATDAVVLAAEGEPVVSALDAVAARVHAVAGPSAFPADNPVVVPDGPVGDAPLEDTVPDFDVAPGDAPEVSLHFDVVPSDDPEAHLFEPLLTVGDGHPAEPAEGDEVEASSAELANPSLGPEPGEPATDAGSEEGTTAVGLDAEPALPDSRDELPEPEAAIVGEPKSPSRGSNTRVLLALAVVLLGIVGSAAMGWVRIPGLSPEASPAPAAGDPSPVALSVPAAESTRDLAYSVAVGAYQDAAQARDRALALATVDGVVASVAPLTVDGAVVHRVLLGPTTDSAAAAALAIDVARAVGASAEGWIVRPTPLAFQIGASADSASAEARVAELAGMDVPAYALPIDYQDGSVRYWIYAGAYADDEEASYLRQQLEEQGLPTSLVARRGRAP